MQKKFLVWLLILPAISFVVARSIQVKSEIADPLSKHSQVVSAKAADKNAGSKKESDWVNSQYVQSNKAEKRALQLLRDGELIAAEKECRRAIALWPKIFRSNQTGDLKQLLGHILLEQGRNKEALQAYLSRQLGTRPEDQLRPNLDAALAYCRLGNFRSAKKYAPDFSLGDMTKKRLDGWPGTTDLRSLEATLILRRGFEKSSSVEEEGALKEFRKVLRMFPHNGLAAYQCARSLMWLKRYDEALPMFARAAYFGNAKTSADAKRRMSGFPKAKREAALREAAKLR